MMPSEADEAEGTDAQSDGTNASALQAVGRVQVVCGPGQRRRVAGGLGQGPGLGGAGPVGVADSEGECPACLSPLA